ncbi:MULTISPECIES: bifunctional DNA primase/polymerase [Rhodomicrobium]|uniref:bifunctional DNA primase/polymerase n=1 Tax=Rhodomicrobium TaxID=1068 RepID=UPI0014824F9C|nr:MULTISPECIES: bifunctional DNA primase/polymerase [Rhodomicrobium]
MLEAALEYARMGWPVFPCNPIQDAAVKGKKRKSKSPLVAGPDKDADGNAIPETGGLWRATTDEAQIRKWWGKYPKALIGVPTGARSGLFVVDLDPAEGETAKDVFDRLWDAVGKFPNGPVSETQSGGMHIWFRNPDGELPHNSAKRIPGVDWRGHGGYVIVPPSVMADGKAYRWRVMPRELPFPAATPRLLDLVFQRGDFAPEKRRGGDAAPSTPARPISVDSPGDKAVRRYAQAALDRARSDVARCPKGSRGHELNAAAYGMAPFVALGALSEREVIAALQDGADLCGLTSTDGAKERDAKIRRGLSAGAQNIGDLDRRLREIREEADRRGVRFDDDGRRSTSPAMPEPPEPVEPPGGSASSGSEPRSGGPGAPPGILPPEDDDTRKVIRIKAGRLPEAVAEAETALIEAGPGPIYQRSGELVHIARRPVRRSDGSEETQETVVNVEQPALLEELAYIARFERFDVRAKGWIPTDPPAKVAEAYYGRRAWRLPNLHHLIATPTMRPDGSILSRQGYDVDTGLYLTWELRGLNVPDKPTRDDAETALMVLTEILKGFPYADRDDGERAGLGLSVALAGLIGAMLRPTLPSAPLIGVTAPKAGTGKSYLVDLIAMIATGRRATCLVSGIKPEEFEKSLGAILLASLPLLSLDNMVQPLTGQLICMALSQERIDMRVLGLSKTANLPTTTALFATGNNLKLQGDLTRRALLCRLDARLERPEERTFESDLLGEVRRRRAELVSAALTIARWGFLLRKGKSDWTLDDPGLGKPFAGFETWCRRVRDPLVELGCIDPVLALDEVRAADPTSQRLKVLVAAWATEIRDKSVTCKQAIHDAQYGNGDLTAALSAVAGEHAGEPNSRRLTNYLTANEGVPVSLDGDDGEPPIVKAFYQDGSYKNATRWQLRDVVRVS